MNAVVVLRWAIPAVYRLITDDGIARESLVACFDGLQLLCHRLRPVVFLAVAQLCPHDEVRIRFSFHSLLRMRRERGPPRVLRRKFAFGLS
jgi:hypothetical protein